MSTTLLLGGGALMLFVFLIIIFAVVIYFLTRPEKETEKETDETPTISGAGVSLVLNPDEETGDDKVETYTIKEYAIGETTAKNIDVKLTWKNGPGFTSVTKLIFVHKANGKQVREDVETSDNVTPNTEYELILPGENLTSDNIVGENAIEMYWNTKDSSNLLETIEFDIFDEHLDSTLDLTQAQNITVATRLASGTTSSGSVITTYTKYHILPFFEKPVYIRKVGDSDGFNIINGGVKESIDGVDVFYIKKALGRTFLSKDTAGNFLMSAHAKKFVRQDDLFKSDEKMDLSNITVKELSPDDDFEYEFTVQHEDNHSGFDAHIHYVELYDYNYNFMKRVTNNDIEFGKYPDWGDKNTKDYLGSWQQGSAPGGTKLFTIKSTKAVGKMLIMYGRPAYGPGWLIKENGVSIWEDKENCGPGLEPKHLIFSYDIRKGTPREFFKIGNNPLIPIGSSVKCKKNDPRNNSNSVYRLVTPNQINWYPDPYTAKFWNPDWNKDIKNIEDCKGIVKGPNMNHDDTGFNSNGEGKVYYLDRHDVNCNNDGLNRFKLTSSDDADKNIRYDFGCQPGLGITTLTEKQTTADLDGDPPHTVYLDRHTVDCDNKPITQFKLNRNSDRDKIFYKYTCGNTTSNKCRDVTTGYNDQGGGNVRYLDRHNVKCNVGEYLSKFRLDSDDNDQLGKYRYEYKCCEI